MAKKHFAASLLALTLLAGCQSTTEDEAAVNQEEVQSTTEESAETGDSAETTDEATAADETEAQEEAEVDITETAQSTNLSELDQLIQASEKRYNYNISHIKLDKEAEKVFYEVATWDGAFHTTYHIDPDSKEVTLADEENNVEELGALTLQNLLQPAEAVQKAIDESGANEVYRFTVAVDDETQIPVYEIETDSDTVKLNAQDGSVL